jgi:hypothetical protein
MNDNTLLGNAALMGIESDLNLSQSESNWSISLVFLAFVRKLRYWTVIILNECFVLADLWNPQHYSHALSRTYACMG